MIFNQRILANAANPIMRLGKYLISFISFKWYLLSAMFAINRVRRDDDNRTMSVRYQVSGLELSLYSTPFLLAVCECIVVGPSRCSSLFGCSIMIIVCTFSTETGEDLTLTEWQRSERPVFMRTKAKEIQFMMIHTLSLSLSFLWCI